MELSFKYTSLELLRSKEAYHRRHQHLLVFKRRGLPEVSQGKEVNGKEESLEKSQTRQVQGGGDLHACEAEEAREPGTDTVGTCPRSGGNRVERGEWTTTPRAAGRTR